MRRVYCLMLHLHTRALTLLYPVGRRICIQRPHTDRYICTHTHTVYFSLQSCFRFAREFQENHAFLKLLNNNKVTTVLFRISISLVFGPLFSFRHTMFFLHPRQGPAVIHLYCLLFSCSEKNKSFNVFEIYEPLRLRLSQQRESPFSDGLIAPF